MISHSDKCLGWMKQHDGTERGWRWGLGRALFQPGWSGKTGLSEEATSEQTPDRGGGSCVSYL